MADQKKRISELPEESSTTGLYTIGVNSHSESVKVPLGKILDGITPKVTEAKNLAQQAKNTADAANNAANNAAATIQSVESNINTALDALRTRVSTNEGNIYTNADDIATLQDDLHSVASALNALSGSGDTTAVIDTFNEVVDFLAGITNNEKLTGKLNELRNLCQDNYEDIGRLKENVSQITQIIDGVGIFPFNTIVEAHDSVIDGAPSYATQFPSAADGAYRHIIFDKSRRTFLWEIHAGDYPNCPAGDAYTSWKGSEEYLSEGHPRADRLYRMGNELYRWDGTTLRSYSADIAAKQDALTTSDDLMISQDNKLSLTDKAKYATFDAQWTAAGGTVIESGKTYECNGLTDITYKQALYIYRHTAQGGRFGQTSWRCLSFRTNLPIQGYGNSNAANEAFRECTSVETINLPATYGKHCRLSVISRMFQQCVKLEAIIGAPIYVWNVAGNSNVNNAFYLCYKLKEVRIVWNCNYDISFSDSPLLSYDTIEYFITNAANTSAITITVHADVYAKLTGDTTNAAAAALTADELAQWQQVLADAMAKNISFATT